MHNEREPAINQADIERYLHLWEDIAAAKICSWVEREAKKIGIIPTREALRKRLMLPNSRLEKSVILKVLKLMELHSRAQLLVMLPQYSAEMKMQADRAIDTLTERYKHLILHYQEERRLTHGAVRFSSHSRFLQTLRASILKFQPMRGIPFNTFFASECDKQPLHFAAREKPLDNTRRKLNIHTLLSELFLGSDPRISPADREQWQHSILRVVASLDEMSQQCFLYRYGILGGQPLVRGKLIQLLNQRFPRNHRRVQKLLRSMPQHIVQKSEIVEPILDQMRQALLHTR